MATKTIGLSLGALFLVCGALFGIALAGGALGSRIFGTPLPLISDTQGTIVPVSQQVTVSPSKLAADIAAAHGKSVFLLAYETPKGVVPFGIGSALTSDGVIMSVAEPGKEVAIAIGEDGSAIALTFIGTDELSGISFYKASERIVPPFGLSQAAPRIASSFLALYRHVDTFQTSGSAGMLSSLLLPLDTTAPGIQKLLRIESAIPIPSGAPLIDENGNLAGVLISSEKNTALATSDIRSALDRLSSNRLSHNPFTSLGFTISWKTHMDANRTMRTQSVVKSVAKGTAAEAAGLKAGDIITAISGNAVSWDTNILDTLSAKPLLLTITRQEESRTISITQ